MPKILVATRARDVAVSLDCDGFGTACEEHHAVDVTGEFDLAAFVSQLDDSVANDVSGANGHELVFDRYVKRHSSVSDDSLVRLRIAKLSDRDHVVVVCYRQAMRSNGAWLRQIFGSYLSALDISVSDHSFLGNKLAFDSKANRTETDVHGEPEYEFSELPRLVKPSVLTGTGFGCHSIRLESMAVSDLDLLSLFTCLLFRYGARHAVIYDFQMVDGAGVLSVPMSNEVTFNQVVNSVGNAVEKAKVTGAQSGAPILISFSDRANCIELTSHALVVKSAEICRVGANTNVWFDVERSSRDEITVQIVYEQSRYSKEFVAQVMRHVSSLIKVLVENPNQPVATLDYLPDSDLVVIKSFWNSERQSPNGISVADLFARQVRRTPDAVAVEFGDDVLTYEELNYRSNELARLLRAEGCKKGQMVGLYMRRSVEQIVAVMALVKAGCVIVPLDISYPKERLRYLVEDSKIATVLTGGITIDDELFPELNVVDIDGMSETLEQQIGVEVDIDLDLEAPLYCIYTSGSTGQPKGVVVNHRAVVNLVEWHHDTWLSVNGVRTLLFSPISFDVAFHEIFAGLTCGARLIQVDEDTRRNPYALHDYLVTQRVHKIYVPYVALQQLSLVASKSSEVLQLQEILVAGEPLRVTAEIKELAKATAGSAQSLVDS